MSAASRYTTRIKLSGPNSNPLFVSIPKGRRTPTDIKVYSHRDGDRVCVAITNKEVMNDLDIRRGFLTRNESYPNGDTYATWNITPLKTLHVLRFLFKYYGENEEV